MNTFLAIVYFLLLAVAFWLIIILFLRLSRLHEVEKSQERTIKELESVIASFAAEMKEQNAQFLKSVQAVKTNEQPLQTNDSDMAIVNELYSDKNKGTVKEQQADNKPQERATHYGIDTLADDDINNLLPDYSKDSFEYEKQPNDQSTNIYHKNHVMGSEKKQSFKHNVLDLRNKGYSIEDIAKQLNKGKTEIELVLKFNEN